MLKMIYEEKFIIALVFTLFVETISLYFIARKLGFLLEKESTVCKEKEIPDLMLVFAGITASSLTLPYLWFVLPAFISDYLIYVLVGELSVFLIEGIYYFFVLRISFRNALIASFICNLGSFALGLLLFKFFL